MYDDINLPESVMRPGHNRVALTIHAFDPDKGQLDNYLRYKNGGMHSAAEKVRKAGRRDDTILLHVNEEEFKQLRDQWGDPIINPDTGLPEYGFLKSLKKILKVVAPIALGFMVPGIGAAIAKAGFMGMSQATATALTGAALGGATGGKKGALMGLVGGVKNPDAGQRKCGHSDHGRQGRYGCCQRLCYRPRPAQDGARICNDRQLRRQGRRLKLRAKPLGRLAASTAGRVGRIAWC